MRRAKEIGRNRLPARGIATGFNAVFSTVRADFLLNFGSEAAEGAPFCSHTVRSFRVRSLRRKSIEGYGGGPW